MTTDTQTLCPEVAAIQQRIRELEERLAHPPVFPTEVYTRIVGYYRSVAAWNKGKREEYRHRTPFVVGTAEPRGEDTWSPRAVSYLFFFRQGCPACPAMKSRLGTLDLEGKSLNVDDPEGLQAAVRHQVMATPTVVFLDAAGREVLRLTDPRDWEKVQRVVSPV